MSDRKPWVDADLRVMMGGLREKVGVELRLHRKAIKRKRTDLVNQYYAEKAENINLAHENRQVAREFREAKKKYFLTPSRTRPHHCVLCKGQQNR